MDKSGAVELLKEVLVNLDDKSGELVEVRKAEEDARRANFQGASVTEARERAAAAASEYVKEGIDLQADIDSLLRWRDFYTLLIEKVL